MLTSRIPSTCVHSRTCRNAIIRHEMTSRSLCTPTRRENRLKFRMLSSRVEKFFFGQTKNCVFKWKVEKLHFSRGEIWKMISWSTLRWKVDTIFAFTLSQLLWVDVTWLNGEKLESFCTQSYLSLSSWKWVEWQKKYSTWTDIRSYELTTCHICCRMSRYMSKRQHTVENSDVDSPQKLYSSSSSSCDG